MKPKLLYLMHVPWGWIKQRPHFIAEKLSKNFEVHVYDIEGLRKRKLYRLNQSIDGEFKIKPIYLTGHLCSFCRKSKIITWIYRKIFRGQIQDFHSYKYVWVTNVIFYKFLEPLLYHDQILIYDCMDDDLEFPYIKSNPSLSSYYLTIEEKLVKRADRIFFSAQYLSEKVFQRSPYDRIRSVIINNAIDLPINNNSLTSDLPLKIKEVLNTLENNHPNLVYVGTISEWFDFDLIKIASKHYPKIKWILFGPNEIALPKSPNIYHLGSIPRQYIFQVMEKADALVMPFKITELIKSVNPVKLYEYIYSGKPVIAPLYGESVQFEPYVYLYKSEKEFYDLCRKMQANLLKPKAPRDKCIDFVIHNTWDNRADYIKSNI